MEVRGEVHLKYCVVGERVVKGIESHRGGMTRKGEEGATDEAFVSSSATGWVVAHL